MRTFIVDVTSTVRVTLDETKFTPQFYEEFTRHFFPYDTLEEHAEHIAQLAAREVFDFGFNRREFVEGYGPIGDFGITAAVTDVATDVVETVENDGVNPHGSGPVPIEPREA